MLEFQWLTKNDHTVNIMWSTDHFTKVADECSRRVKKGSKQMLWKYFKWKYSRAHNSIQWVHTLFIKQIKSSNSFCAWMLCIMLEVHHACVYKFIYTHKCIINKSGYLCCDVPISTNPAHTHTRTHTLTYTLLIF